METREKCVRLGVSKSGKVRFFFARNRFGAFFWAGVALLVLGLGMFYYANAVVTAHEQLLQGDLSTHQRDQIAGSLAWWRITQITVYNPIALVFIVTGVLCILYACIWATMQPISVESPR